MKTIIIRADDPLIESIKKDNALTGSGLGIYYDNVCAKSEVAQFDRNSDLQRLQGARWSSLCASREPL